MKCPRCNSSNTHLSWLREFIVIYWCNTCHTGFDVDRHHVRSAVSSHVPQTEHDHQPSIQSVT